MSAVPLPSHPEYEVFSSDYYPAKLVSAIVEDRPADKFNAKPYQQIRWGWVLFIKGRDDRPSFTSWTNISMHEKSTMYALLNALGVDVSALPKAVGADGVEYPMLELDDLLGKICRINIQEVQAKDGKTKNKVAGYASMPRAVAGGKPAAAAKPSPAAPKPEPAPVAAPTSEDDDPFAGDDAEDESIPF